MRHYRNAALAAVAGAMLSAGWAAAEPIEVKITTVSVPNDIHTKALQVFKDALNEAMPDHFDIQIYDSGTLFGQSGDMDALQRGNAEMAYVSFQLIADNIPEFGIFTAGYLFQSPEHARKVMASDIGQQVKAKVSEDLGLQLLDTCYLGTRQLNLREEKDVQTPEDLAGVKLRMPSSDAWLFLGTALGANPTPLPFSDVYLALQTGTIDAQDNPLPTVEAAKFYEVTNQIVMTSHLVDFINLTVNNQTWENLTPEEQAAMQAAATKACDWNNAERTANEQRLVAFLEEKGLKVTSPDVDAFRTHVQDYYLNSDRAKDWPEGWVEEINAMGD
jgi:tripartite ATP-independent transporter DctP family solute receptor